MNRVTHCLVASALVLAFAGPGSAKTPDGRTPAQEQVCTEARLDRNQWGLCNAYCEAMDCDGVNPHASVHACERVYDNFVKASDGAIPPCLHEGPNDEEQGEI